MGGIAALSDIARGLEQAAPEQILEWALHEYRDRIALACSFGGPTGLVALDMALAMDSSVTVYYLDTDLLFPQTYALIERVSKRYGISPIAVASELSLEEQSELYGEALWKRNPDRCCELRKVEPQARFLQDYAAWITGVRRDQTRDRLSTPVVQWDQRFELVKVSPFVSWDEQMVWTYVRAHDLDYNELHDRSYPSIGCTHCTRAVEAGADARSGRWPDVAKLECGLHVRD